MAGIREAKKQETREAISAAAMKLFSEKGYEQTSMEDIAREAEVGKATIYGYFKNKQEIFIAFCDEELDRSLEKLQLDKMDNKPIIEILVGYFALDFLFFENNREFASYFLREMAFPHEMNETTREHDQRYLEILDSIIRHAQDTGEIDPQLDVFMTSIHFFSLYLGVLVGWFRGFVNSPEEFEQKLTALFLQALDGVRP